MSNTTHNNDSELLIDELGFDPDALILVTEILDGLRARMAEEVREVVTDGS